MRQWTAEEDRRLEYLNELGFGDRKIAELLNVSCGVRITRYQVEKRRKRLRNGHMTEDIDVADDELLVMEAVVARLTQRSLRAAARKRCRTRCQNGCEVCGSIKYFTIHHIIPQQYGGGWSDSNLMGLCERCHKAVHDINGAYHEIHDRRHLAQIDELREMIIRAERLAIGRTKRQQALQAAVG